MVEKARAFASPFKRNLPDANRQIWRGVRSATVLLTQADIAPRFRWERTNCPK